MITSKKDNSFEKGFGHALLIILGVAILGGAILIATLPPNNEGVQSEQKGSKSYFEEVLDEIGQNEQPDNANGENTETPTVSPNPTKMPFGMRFAPLEQICDFSVVTVWWDALRDDNGNFDYMPLETARQCGTKVMLRLSRRTQKLLQDDGSGLDLQKYEENIKPFVGKIDSFVNDGTIIAHLTIDEPHDCNNDWGGECPTFDELEEAARISKKYWPTLPTVVHTIPRFASQYIWIDTDILHFQYAYHKGLLANFIADGIAVYQSGKSKNISWSFQTIKGGCEKSRECNMSPEQALQVGKALCDTKTGLFVSFSSYNPEILTDEMWNAINELKTYCENSL